MQARAIIETKVVGRPSAYYHARPGEHMVAAALLDPAEDKVYLGDFHLVCRDAWIDAHPDTSLGHSAIVSIAYDPNFSEEDLKRLPELRDAPAFQEGFWTSNGRFVTRTEAAKMTRRRKQPDELDAFDICGPDALDDYKLQRRRGPGMSVS